MNECERLENRERYPQRTGGGEIQGGSERLGRVSAKCERGVTEV